jgi:hypothetical protein
MCIGDFDRFYADLREWTGQVATSDAVTDRSALQNANPSCGVVFVPRGEWRGEPQILLRERSPE